MHFLNFSDGGAHNINIHLRTIVRTIKSRREAPNIASFGPCGVTQNEKMFECEAPIDRRERLCFYLSKRTVNLYLNYLLISRLSRIHWMNLGPFPLPRVVTPPPRLDATHAD